MTVLAFCSVAIAFAFAVLSTCLYFGGIEVMDTPSNSGNVPNSVSMVFEESTPIYSSVQTQRVSFGAYRKNRLVQARINALAIMSDARDAVDCIQWATARDAVSHKYSFNPLAMSDRARWGYDKVYGGEDAVYRIQDVLSDLDLTALTSW